MQFYVLWLFTVTCPFDLVVFFLLLDVKESTDSTQTSGAGAKEKGDSTAKTTKTQSKLSKTVKQVPVETTVDHSVLETLEVFDLSDNEAWVRILLISFCCESSCNSKRPNNQFWLFKWENTKWFDN